MAILCYLLSVVLCNFLFVTLPVLHIGAAIFPPATLLVGVVFVLRDYVQRDYGVFWAYVAIFFAAAFTLGVTSPQLAAASAASFIFGELVETFVYTATRRRMQFAQRVFLSVLLSAPVESALFLGSIHQCTIPNIISMTAGKLVCAIGIVFWYRYRAERV